MGVDERDYFLCWRSSSAPKKLAARFRISLARLSSRFSCSRSLIRWDSAVDTPGAYPSSISAWRTQERTDSIPYPSWRATRCTVPCSVPNSARNARTIRTAAAFSSGLYRRDVGFPGTCSFGMTPSSFPRSGASTYPRAIQREECLRVPQRRRKKRLTGIGVTVGAMSPIRPNVIWAMDFQFDTTADGRTLKMLNVIDEFTREALAIEVDRRIDADGVVDVLDHLAITRGAPVYVRFDNGPEFVAHVVRDWCRFNSAGSLFIDPGSPWQNAWIESFNGRLRDELLNSWRFDSLLEARVIIEDWRCDYNANRPHTAHGQLTPAEFALQWNSIRVNTFAAASYLVAQSGS